MHAWPAFGTFITDDYYVPSLDVTALDGLERGRLLIKHPSRSLKYLFLMPGDLDNSAVGGDIALQYCQSSGGAAWIVYLINDGLVVNGRYRLDIFLQGFTGYCHAVTVQQPGIQQPLHN